ncbi:ecto-ADP-ribosyltransferase 5-like [Poeciliopsis prolifica]|uniref:ecto-ADP-ribosyltransferase 5-like n=1 Tax=Poeciliopsis prolifica TaxID=188132 RepID=UPI0024139D06|nr:ecto-ADP-ribosyltransferase 5-like [Poeciliopsis prolifica]
MTFFCPFFLLQRSEGIQLELYEDSIDDMFSNCKEEMRKMLSAKFSYKLEEKGYETHCVDEKSKIEKIDDILTQEELQAIRVYTEHTNAVYKIFNPAVRTGKNEYGKNICQFHKLYFLLVSSVQKLKIADKEKCYTTYKRYSSEVKFKSDKIRLGSFASSSLTPDQKDYGKKSCLKIKTCHGADIEKYSAYPEEKEVLIPPYEMFELTKNNDVKELKDCETTFVLESIGTKSNLDCKLVKK